MFSFSVSELFEISNEAKGLGFLYAATLPPEDRLLKEESKSRLWQFYHI